MLTSLLVLAVAGASWAVPLHDDVTPRQGEACGYESCTQAEPGMLNVHIIAHTHDDVGWLKTVDQYYYGSRNNIQKAGVQYILDSVIKELWEDEKRRFIYVETAFFWKWWTKQPDGVRHKVHALVRQGRLQFVGGAWSMNDEAAAHYQSTIDQFTWGLGKLNETFGACGIPRVGWQIDPFGHSREFASLLAAMGYDGLFLGRIDYQDKRQRLGTKTMEMLWRGDDDLGKSSDIFTGVLYNTYSPPPGFCFDVLCNDEPIIDDTDSPMYNVDERVKDFMRVIDRMSKAYRADNILVTMGDDFNYQDAVMWFRNLDKLIEYCLDENPIHILCECGPLMHKRYTHVEKHLVDPDEAKIFTAKEIIHFLKDTQALLQYITKQSSSYGTNNVALTMGGDFTYQDAGMWYHNLDKLILNVNLRAAKEGKNVKLFYSTPTCYLKAVKDANPTLPVKQDDFFPYASDPTAYWTGYFTSRPTTKYFEREGNNYLQMAKQLQVLAGLEEHNMFVLNELKSAMGVMQHHDAITGTEKQHVTHDYERLLDQAIDESLIIARQAFNKVIQGDALKPPLFTYSRCRLNESSCDVSENSEQFVVTVYNHLAWKVNEAIRVPVLDGDYSVFAPNGDQITSQLVDITTAVKNIPTRKSRATHEIVFIAYLHPVSLKSFYIRKNKKVVKRDIEEKNGKRKIDFYENLNEYWKHIREQPDIDIKNIEQDTVVVIKPKIPEFPIKSRHIEIPKDVDINVLKDKKEEFSDDLEELEKIIREAKSWGTVSSRNLPERKMYPVLNEDEMRMLSDEPRVVERPDDEEIGFKNIKLRVNNKNEITHAIPPNGPHVRFETKYAYYPGCYGDNTVYTARSSGAYIFRPNATQPVTLDAKYTIEKGPVVVENRGTVDGNVATITRLYDGMNYIENEWLVGPINIDDGIGKEYIVSYVTDIVNNGEFYTDSNGRQVLKRKLNKRPQWNVSLDEPIAGNYYPVTNEIFIQDAEEKFVVLTDRSEGGSSLAEGQIELMLHRRLLHDDAFGVGEALNEIAEGKGLVVRGKHRVLITKPNDRKSLIEEKKMIYQLHLQPQIFVSDAKDITLEEWLKLKNCHSFANSLPDGVHLLTLEPWGTKLLLRLENYIENDNSIVQVDLDKIFTKLTIKSFKETKLAAHQWLDDAKWAWNTEREFSGSFNKDYGSFDNVDKAKDISKESDDGMKVKLSSKQIRTFVVDYEIKL